MNEPLKILWSTMHQAIEASDAAAATLPSDSRSGFSPWALWLLNGLVRHRKRQLWVADIVQTKLSGEPELIGAAGWMGHPEEVPGQGVVPGMTDWEYRFHGRGCLLKHRITGESIDVDFYDETGEWIDARFYCRYLKSLREPEPPERRLIELHPSVETITVTLAELTDAGAISLLPGHRTVVKLADEIVVHTKLFKAFCDVWSTPARRFTAALHVGDWFAACDNMPERTSIHDLPTKADHCRRERKQRLLRELESPQPDRAVLPALAEVQAEELEAIIDKLLREPPSSLMNCALDLLVERNDPAWYDRLFNLLRRLDPNADIPEPAAWIRCASHLLKQGYRQADVLTDLCRARQREVADAALLLLEHSPERCLPLFRAALRSSVPYDRSKAAAMLGVLDEEWGRREMIEALWESQDQEMTCECRAALCCSRSAEAHQAVAQWEEQFPYVPDGRPGYSATDAMLQHCDSFLQYQMTQFHDRVLPLRGRVK